MEYTWQNMEERPRTRNNNQGRGGDFVGGIDNEALDFSQLEAFINSDGSQSNGNYFTESLNNAQQSGNVIVENKRTPGHSLPESPPDSSSEHPYSPPDNCDPPLTTSETIYTTLGQPIYKQNLLNPIITENIILGSHIVVSDQNADPQLLENGNLLHQDTRILVGNDICSTTTLLNPRLEGDSNLNDQLLLTDEQNRNLENYVDRRNQNEILLVKNPEGYNKNLLHLGFTPTALDIQIPQRTVEPLCENGLDNMQAVYTNLQNAPKKRKLSQDLIVKSEPEHCSPGQLSPPNNMNSSVDEDYAASESCLSDSQYQCIRFQPFQQNAWHALCDQNLTELPSPHYRVDADKGFNFSNADDAFVCQKKNHFQITCHVQQVGDAQFVKTSEGFQKISSFHLHFYGVKHDCPTQTIRVEQSQSDRSKKPFHPVLVELVNSQVTKVTVGRLHFSETTSNNMRKKGKPNPEQRYFQLVVGLHAHTSHGDFPIISHASQKIIVRASNPGQFESDVELCWQKGQTQDSIFHAGKVGVNTDRPDESLVVHGNLKITGHIIQPSDLRAKKNIVECNTAEQLRNVQKLRVVRYEYEPGFASQLNRVTGYCDTGVIAQEVAEILPEAVRPAGNLVLENGTSIDNFLVVNKERIFMENIGAVKELCKVTDNLETRIDQLEKINKHIGNKYGKSFSNTVNSIKHKKCTKYHECPDGSEFCSNKFIQVVIIILVLIMAFCLAAMTTLYLLESNRHNQMTQAGLQAMERAMTTKSPTKSPKYTWNNMEQSRITSIYKENGAFQEMSNKGPHKNYENALGRPADCPLIEEDIENSNLCATYCCKSDATLDIYRNQQAIPPYQRANKSETLLSLDKSKITRPFHSNNIEKPRQKRDTDDWNDRDNNYDGMMDDLQFTIILQGKHFNATLSDTYLSPPNTIYNYTYIIPISKYMPDEYINIIFQSSQPPPKNIEHCYNNYKRHECPWLGDDNTKTQIERKINENIPMPQINSPNVIFEIEMHGFQSKILTYRASLKQTQNKCKLSPSKLGIEFTEYNIHLYRQCHDE